MIVKLSRNPKKIRLFPPQADGTEVVTELFEAIDELPERCREIFYMAYLQEKEEKQIAELLRVSVNTVKTQKQRAKAYLKGRLGELFVYMTLFFFEF